MKHAHEESPGTGGLQPVIDRQLSSVKPRTVAEVTIDPTLFTISTQL